MKTGATLEHWPIVVCELHEGYTDSDLERLLAVFDAALSRGERYVNLVAPHGVNSVPSPRQRSLLTDWANRPDVQMRQVRWNLGTAIVVESTIIRGAFTALGWLWKSPTELVYTKTVSESAAWCSNRLAQAGVEQTFASLAYLRRVGA